MVDKFYHKFSKHKNHNSLIFKSNNILIIKSLKKFKKIWINDLKFLYYMLEVWRLPAFRLNKC
jgi:hypothetical protein